MVRYQTPEITWHGGEGGKNAPVLSLDYHPTDRHVLVSGGADAEARVWLVDGESTDKPRFLFALTDNEAPINCVRWSPDGNSLASGADGGTLMVWNLRCVFFINLPPSFSYQEPFPAFLLRLQSETLQTHRARLFATHFEHLRMCRLALHVGSFIACGPPTSQ